MFIVCHRLALPEVRSSAFSSIFEQLAKTVFGGRARRGWTAAITLFFTMLSVVS
jgi:hypothetical protein